VLTIQNATLVNPNNVEEVTQRVYDYYQQRHLQKTKLFAPGIEVGNSVLVDTLYDNQIAGVVEKMELDLAFGFVAMADIVGVVA
jgi:hypothetical protein